MGGEKVHILYKNDSGQHRVKRAFLSNVGNVQVGFYAEIKN